ncbi:hypothetical protein F2P81_018285 [Scophthalmus maximus]|uniref:Ubiquitin carboxyl-terminal hydrolase n=1 Tax=Scophthalmus maximus TaxID=52904 RepID=A0A6A4SBS9_SCOMX|nr:hypothetical protein F2P81_018285 [Scophthalmus maximus]
MTDVDSGQTFIVNSRSTSPADINYHGLLNQGATCYLNSVLQVLFMTGDFREAVERYTCSNPGTECIDHQLKPLFEDLKKKTANTSKLTDKLGIDSVYEQRDAAEYCERILTLTSPEASQIFHGELTHRTTCSACGTETNVDGPFWHLPLGLVESYREHYSVVDGIEEHFRTSYFRGENQMYCDQCDTKSDAATTCVMRRPPEVLMLLLKRFELDYRHMTYVKNDRVVVVPCALQIPENQTYELYAVVEHFGDLRGGHYTATIKSQDDERWYNFNDATVTLVRTCVSSIKSCKTVSKTDSSCNAPYRRQLGYQPFQLDNVERKKKSKRRVLPAPIDNDDRLAGVVKVTEREQGEETVEAGNDTPEALPIDGNEETGIKDIVGVGSREVGLLHDLMCDVEDEDNAAGVRQRLPRECESDYLPDEKREQDEGEIMKDEEEEGGAEADEQAEKRGLFSAGARLGDTVEDQDCGRAGAGVDRDLTLEASGGHATPDPPDEKDEMSEDQGRVLSMKMGSDELTGGDEQLEKREKSSTRYLDSHAEYQDGEGVDNAGKNASEDQGEKQEDCDLQLVSAGKMADEAAREIDVRDASEGKTGADKLTPGRQKLLTKYDLCRGLGGNGRVGNNDQNRPEDHQTRKREAGPDDGLQLDNKLTSGRRNVLTKYDLCRGLGDNGRVGDSEQNRPEDDWGFKRGGSSSRLCKRHEQDRE